MRIIIGLVACIMMPIAITIVAFKAAMAYAEDSLLPGK